MAWIGFCTQCGSDVVVTEAGSCPHGHPYESVRDIRQDTVTPDSFGADTPVALDAPALPDTHTAAEESAVPATSAAPKYAASDTSVAPEDSAAPDTSAASDTSVAPEDSAAPDTPAAPKAAGKPNRTMLVVLVALLNVVLVGGLLFAGATAFGWLGLAAPSLAAAPVSTPAPAKKPAASVAETATAKPQATATSKPAPKPSPAKTAPATAPAPSKTAAIDLGKAAGSWRNSDRTAEVLGIVLDPDSPQVIVKTASGSEQLYPAEIRIDADGTLTIEAEPLAAGPVTGRITELTAAKLVVKSLGTFTRVTGDS